MGLNSLVQALHNNQYGNDNIRQIVLPVTGLGAGTGLGAILTTGAALTFGDLQDVALPAAITQRSRITAIFLDTPSIVETYLIEVGLTTSLGVAYANAAAVTAAGAAAILGCIRRATSFHIAVALGVYGGWQAFTTPIYVPNGVGVVARASSVSGGDTINIKIAVEQGWDN